MNRRIFAFTGLPGVGKTAVAHEFANYDGFPIVNMGEEIERHKDRAIRGDTLNTWDAATRLRGEFGECGPAYACVSQIASEFIANDIVVVDGIRSVVEVETFKQVFDCPVHCVAVTADEDKRLERFAERSGYYVAFEDWEESDCVAEAIAEYELAARTEREKDVGLADALDYANYTIDNNGDLSDASMQCARLLDDFEPLIS